MKSYLRFEGCPEYKVDSCAHGIVSDFIQNIMPKKEAVQDGCSKAVTEKEMSQKLRDEFNGISDAEISGILEKMEKKGIIERLSENVYRRISSCFNMPI